MRVLHLRVRRRAPGAMPGPTLVTLWSAGLAGPLASPEWRPPCDVVESTEGWTVTAELGGLTDDDFEVRLYEDSVVIQGERPWRGAVGGVRVHLAEIRYGPFRFALDLPVDCDRGAVRASYERGILTLMLPRTGGGAS